METGAESLQPSASRHISHLLSVVCTAFPSTCRRSQAVCNEGFPSAAAPIKMGIKRDHGGSSPGGAAVILGGARDSCLPVC